MGYGALWLVMQYHNHDHRVVVGTFLQSGVVAMDQPTPQEVAAERLRALGLNAVVERDTPSFVTIIYPQPIWEPARTCSYSGVVYAGYHVRAFSSYLNTANETMDHFVARVISSYHEKFPPTNGPTT